LGLKATKELDIKTSNEVLLFGNISLEGRYEDKPSHSPITAASRIQRVCSSVKDNKTQCVELKMDTTHCN